MALIPPTAYIPTNNITAETIQLPEGSLSSHIGILDNLITANGKVVEWAGDMRLKTAGDVEIDAIPSAPNPYPNVLAYDTANKKLYYQGDYTGTIKGINAGNNIAVDTTNPALPTVRLQDEVSVATVEAPVVYTEQIGLPPTSGSEGIIVNQILSCAPDPLEWSHLTNKQYVDDGLSGVMDAMPSIVGSANINVTTDEGNTSTIDLASIRPQNLAVNFPKNLVVDEKGRVIACGNGTDPLTAVSAGTGISVTGATATPIVSLANIGAAAVYNNVRNITVDSYGRVTAGQTNTAPPVLSVGAGTGINIDYTNPQAPVVKNAGLVGLTAGEGITLDTTNSQSPIVKNGGILSVTAGSGIQVGGSAGKVTITNAGVRQVVQGGGLLVTGASDTPTVGLETTGSQGTYTNPSSISVDLYGRIASVTSGPVPLQYSPTFSFNTAYVNTTLNTTTFTNLQDFPLTNFPVFNPTSGTTMTYSVAVCLQVRPQALQSITQDLQAYLTLVWPNGTENASYPGGSTFEPVVLNTSPYSSLAKAVVSWNTTIQNAQHIQYPMSACKLRLYLRSVGANQPISSIWLFTTFTPVAWSLTSF